MKWLLFPSVCALALMFTVQGCAHGRKAALKEGKAEAQVLESRLVRTMPGRSESPTEYSYSFLIVWKSATEPGQFFWKGDKGWLAGNVSFARGVRKTPEGFLYEIADLGGSAVHKGDTIEVRTMKGGKYAIPAGIEGSKLTNTLFFNSDKTGWRYLAVPRFSRTQDITLP